MYESVGSATSALINQGTLIVNGNSIINGPLTASSGSIVRLLPDNTTAFAALTMANGFTNNGTIELEYRGPLPELLGWLHRHSPTDVRIEPLGLGPIYQRFHGGDS